MDVSKELITQPEAQELARILHATDNRMIRKDRKERTNYAIEKAFEGAKVLRGDVFITRFNTAFDNYKATV